MLVFYIKIIYFAAPIKKKTRGPNRSKATSFLIGQTKKKLEVSAREGELHPYGDNASKFASEIGILVREYAPLRVKGWSNVDGKDKEVIYARIKVNCFNEN